MMTWINNHVLYHVVIFIPSDNIKHIGAQRSGFRLLVIELLLACRLPRLLCLSESPTLLPFPENVSRTYARCLLPGLLYNY